MCPAVDLAPQQSTCLAFVRPQVLSLELQNQNQVPEILPRNPHVQTNYVLENSGLKSYESMKIEKGSCANETKKNIIRKCILFLQACQRLQYVQVCQFSCLPHHQCHQESWLISQSHSLYLVYQLCRYTTQYIPMYTSIYIHTVYLAMVYQDYCLGTKRMCMTYKLSP